MKPVALSATIQEQTHLFCPHLPHHLPFSLSSRPRRETRACSAARLDSSLEKGTKLIPGLLPLSELSLAAEFKVKEYE